MLTSMRTRLAVVVAGAMLHANAPLAAPAPYAGNGYGHWRGGGGHGHGGGGHCKLLWDQVEKGWDTSRPYYYAPTYYDQPYYAQPDYAAPYHVAPDRVAYCAARFRSYDIATRTYLGYDGYRHYC